MNSNEVALFTSCLISTDILISSSVTKFKHFPTLFSIILGAGLWNDSVVVVLTQVFAEFLCPHVGIFNAEGVCTNDPNEPWKASSLYKVPLTFLYITAKALLVGLAFGVLTSIVTKYFRFMTKSPIQETFFIVLMGLMAYYIGEELEASGVTSLIICTIMQAQYAWYNLSPQGKHASGITIATMGYLAEAFVFVLIGLGLTEFIRTAWAPFFALMCVAVSFVTRMVSTLVIHYLFVACKRRKSLEFKEVFYLGFQGNIKGAIPLAFIIKFENSITNKEVAITTMIIIVVSTVLIYGSLMPLVAHLVLGKREVIHHGPRIHIKSGCTFNETPHTPDLAHAFNYSPSP